MAHLTLVTLHGKEAVIGPIVQGHGWTFSVVDAPTDQLGTFAGDVPRPAAPRETAAMKARLLELGPNWNAASEGTVRDGGLLGPALDELVVALRHSSPVIVGTAHAPLPCVRSVTLRHPMSLSEIEEQLTTTWPLPHSVMATVNNVPVVRDVTMSHDVARRLAHELRETREVRVFTDVRAHRCPERLAVIASATHDLMDRLITHCPRCDQPGFGAVADITGRPCELCCRPTAASVGHVMRCPWCDHHEEKRQNAGSIDPAFCEWCNP